MPTKEGFAETAGHIRQAPKVLGRIRQEVVQNFDVKDSGTAISAILAEENYTLSPKEQVIFEKRVPLLITRKAAVNEARQLPYTSLDKKFFGIKNGIPKRFFQHREFFGTSVTLAMKPRDFAKYWENLHPDDEIPWGFTSPDMILPIGEDDLAYSLRDIKSDRFTSAHEDLHRQYEILHRDYADGQDLEFDELKAVLDDAVENGDRVLFAHGIKVLYRLYMYLYLNELGASAPKNKQAVLKGKKVTGVIDQFAEWQNNDYCYAKHFKKQIKELHEDLPEDPVEKAPWDRVIWETAQQADGMMEFVEKYFCELARTAISAEELTDIIQSLTPETAFLLPMFLQDKIPTLQQGLEWAREYFRPSLTRNKERKKYDWANFLGNEINHARKCTLPWQSHYDNLVRNRPELAIDDDVKETPPPFTDALDQATGEIITFGQESIDLMTRLLTEYFAVQSNLKLTEQNEVARIMLERLYNGSGELKHILRSYHHHSEKVSEGNDNFLLDDIRENLILLTKRSLDVADIFDFCEDAD